MIQIYENFLPVEYFEKISNIVMDEFNMPWFFSQNISGQEKTNKEKNIEFGFYHNVLKNNVASNLFDDFCPIINIMQTKYNIEIFNLLRIRLGMQVKVDKRSILNLPHTDYDKPHKVLLLYLNESDGKTFFYNNNLKKIKSISPSPNKAVLFDGNILHSSSTPKKYSRRIALNINFNYFENEY